MLYFILGKVTNCEIRRCFPCVLFIACHHEFRIPTNRPQTAHHFVNFIFKPDSEKLFFILLSKIGRFNHKIHSHWPVLTMSRVIPSCSYKIFHFSYCIGNHMRVRQNINPFVAHIYSKISRSAVTIVSAYPKACILIWPVFIYRPAYFFLRDNFERVQ